MSKVLEIEDHQQSEYEVNTSNTTTSFTRSFGNLLNQVLYKLLSQDDVKFSLK